MSFKYVMLGFLLCMVAVSTAMLLDTWEFASGEIKFIAVVVTLFSYFCFLATAVDIFKGKDK